jgi:hypothetical protein
MKIVSSSPCLICHHVCIVLQCVVLNLGLSVGDFFFQIESVETNVNLIVTLFLCGFDGGDFI